MVKEFKLAFSAIHYSGCRNSLIVEMKREG